LPVVSSENRCRAGGLVCKRQRADGFRARRRAAVLWRAIDRSGVLRFWYAPPPFSLPTTPDCAMMRDDGRFFRGLRKFLLTDGGACAKIRADGAQMCGVPEMG